MNPFARPNEKLTQTLPFRQRLLRCHAGRLDRLEIIVFGHCIEFRRVGLFRRRFRILSIVRFDLFLKRLNQIFF